jgi:capsule polysaccharide export protein KpsC/LpsZ
MTMWQDDPKKVGNLIKEEKVNFEKIEQVREALKHYKTKNFKKYKIKIPYNPKN